MTFNSIKRQMKSWKFQNKKTVLATGVFDILHIEHLRFLKKAKAAGDTLVVGVESDRRAASIKGFGRPINSQKIRREQIEALNVVDLSFILPKKFGTQHDWEEFMAALRPDIYAISSNDAYHKNKQRICKTLGIDLKVVHKYNPRYSTSLLAARLLDPHIGKRKCRYSTAVLSGHGRGKKIGIPTLNLIKPRQFPYQHGIYAGYVWLGRERYQGAFHFGPIPVFGQTRVSLEVFLLNCHGDIRRKTVSFQLIQYLRPIKAFSSPKELRSQMNKDIGLAKSILSAYE
jgi:cytidyltransferase-like protein